MIKERLYTSVPMNDASAAYTCSMGSCILETLDQGAFSGLLGESAKLLDRDPELERFINEILARAKELRLKQNANKRQSPALVVAQAPGAGKSHFLAKLGEEIPKLYDLQGNEQIPIVSAFTYNSAMGRKPVHDLMADLVLRILYGAAFHMSPSKRHYWPQFMDSVKSDARLLECLSEGGVDLAVEILRECYGQRPIVILADEVAKSTERYGPDAEGIVRRALCQAMDTFGSQVFVVMSALSKYNTVKQMFKGSQRNVKIQVLGTLQSDAFRSFCTRLFKIAEERETRDKTEAWKSTMWYRIGLAWGATGGYARAIEAMVQKIVNSQGPLNPDVLQSGITQLRQMDSFLPGPCSLEELERVLEFWELHDCPAEYLGEVQSAFPETSYDGRVLIEAVASGTGVRYVPTVAPWHAAKRLTDQSLRNKTFSRCERLMEVIGSAYQKKVQAIKDNKKKSMKEASSYLTEVTAAWGVMFAIVKKYDQLPSCIKTVALGDTSQISLDTTLAEDASLATPTGTGETEALKKLKMFLQKAIPEGPCEFLRRLFGIPSKPFLVMAPPNCMAVDFLVLQDNVVVAVQVKSDTITKDKKIREQKELLQKAANTMKSVMSSMNFNREMQFLAVLGSNYNTDNLDFRCLKQEDLARLIPPFLRQLSGLAAAVQSLDDEE